MDIDKLIKFIRDKYLYISIILLVIGVASGYVYFSNTAYTVVINDKIVGLVKEEEEVNKIINDIKSEMKKKYQKDIKISQNIVVEKSRMSRDELTSIEAIKNELYRTLDFKVQGYSITVDSKDLVYLENKYDAEKLLEEIKTKYISGSEDMKEIYFIEKVEVLPRDVDIYDLVSSTEALDDILLGGKELKKYSVQSGDTAWNIAINFDLTIEDIQRANTEINLDRLQIGQEISLNVPQPYINVKTIETITYEENISFGIVYEENSDIFIGEQKVQKKGEVGKKKLEVELIKINGILDSKNVLKEEILKEPIHTVILKGTKERPKTLAYGSFAPPSRGGLTSRFGRRWGRDHDGIDIAGPIGSPITAADGGKIISVGWINGYGNTVIIDHENGYKTLYAHAKEIKVKKGERVSRGQIIATIGTSGKVTGPNVHFEVHKNGVPVDPLNYLKL